MRNRERSTGDDGHEAASAPREQDPVQRNWLLAPVPQALPLAKTQQQQTLQAFVNQSPRMLAQRRALEPALASQGATPPPGSNRKAPVQRYFSPTQLGRQDMAPEARISEGGNIIWMAQKQVFATRRMFDQANDALQSKSQILLQPVNGRDFKLSLPEDEQQMSEIVLGDHFAVMPTYNPARMPSKDPRLALGPSFGDDPTTIAPKHNVYIGTLRDFLDTYRKFMKTVGEDSKSFPPTETTVIDANRWVTGTPNGDLIRTEIAVAFFGYKEHKDHQRLMADLEKLREAIQTFIAREIANETAIILPNDCAQCVSEIVGGERERSREDGLFHSPKIGSNYYAGLEGPEHGSFGWNFHWAGVVMKDGTDNLTLETAAGLSMAASAKDTWWFSLYGTRLPDQTFKKQINRIHFQRNIQEAKVAKWEAIDKGLNLQTSSEDRSLAMQEIGKQRQNMGRMAQQLDKVEHNDFNLARPPQPVIEEPVIEQPVIQQPVNTGSALMQEVDPSELPDWVQRD